MPVVVVVVQTASLQWLAQVAQVVEAMEQIAAQQHHLALKTQGAVEAGVVLQRHQAVEMAAQAAQALSLSDGLSP
jgi:hypothetical protein